MTFNHTRPGESETGRTVKKNKDPSDVKDYSTTNEEKRRKERRTTIAVIVAIAVLVGLTVFLLVKPLVSGWNDEVDSRITPPGESNQPFNRPTMRDTPSTTTQDEPEADGDKSKQARSKSPVKADDIELPDTQNGDWTDVVNPEDRITKDTKAATHIQQLIDTAAKELQGVDVDPSNPDRRLMDVANYYFYGNKQVVSALVSSNNGQWVRSKDSLTVYDHENDGVYSFTYYMKPGQRGGSGYLMAGWYDPQTDSLKVKVASPTTE